ncbi:MAG: GTP cyclohydrolase I FolE2 [Deltaproteobacteria bacterium]|nr:GTP cyclohydrolase I FolE2 [Deltaproteobacteria bacterium]
MLLDDVHKYKDERRIPIDQVGIKGIKYPITIADKLDRAQQTIATINMFVDLHPDRKGTHMSRFVEIIHEYRHAVHLETIPLILQAMRDRLDARSAYLDFSFPFFLPKKAPVSELVGYFDYQCRFWGKLDEKGLDLFRAVTVPVATLCPCSKQISDRGAHNQRSVITVSFRTKGLCWMEEVILMAEGSASAPLFSLVKRSDEKFLTEAAYDKPCFVEDVVRELALKLDAHPSITWYAIEADSSESIHNHNAYAFIKSKKPV